MSVLPAKGQHEFFPAPETWAASPTQSPEGDKELSDVFT